MDTRSEEKWKLVYPWFKAAFLPGLGWESKVLGVRHAACTLKLENKEQAYILRLFDTRFHPAEWIQQELAYLQLLPSHFPKAPVPHVMGVQQLEVYQGLLLEFLPGRHPEFSLADFNLLGKGLGQIHELSHTLAGQVKSRTAWDFKRFWNREQSKFLFQLLPSDVLRLLQVRLDQIAQVFERHWQNSLLEGLIHSEPHPGNILIHWEQAYFIDWGECGQGCYFFDLAVPLADAFWESPQQATLLREALWAAYLEYRPACEAYGGDLPYFIALRMLEILHWPFTEWVPGKWQAEPEKTKTYCRDVLAKMEQLLARI